MIDFGRIVNSPYLVYVVLGAVVVIGILVWIWRNIMRLRREMKQREIDRANVAAYKVWKREIAASGQIKPIACDLMLGSGEECLRVEDGVTLYEVREVKNSKTSFGAMQLGETNMVVGSGTSKSESTDEWRAISTGRLYVTNLRLYFDGDKLNRQVEYKDLTTINGEPSAMVVNTQRSEKSMILHGLNGKICHEIVMCATGRGSF